jgi:hypothetical protein
MKQTSLFIACLALLGLWTTTQAADSNAARLLHAVGQGLEDAPPDRTALPQKPARALPEKPSYAHGRLLIDAGDGNLARVEFSAWEATSKMPAGGSFKWEKFSADGTTIVRTLIVEFTTVDVYGNKAYMVGVKTYDSAPTAPRDTPFVMFAEDGDFLKGRPSGEGSEEDMVMWIWPNLHPAYTPPIKSGDLEVIER